MPKLVCYLLVILIPYTSFANIYPDNDIPLRQYDEDSGNSDNVVALILCFGIPLIIGIIWWAVEDQAKQAKQAKREECNVKKLEEIELGMGKMRVKELMGFGNHPVVRGSIVNKYKQVIEVWEYNLYDENSHWTWTYWLYFCDNKLVQWGRAGDWEREADRIYEMRFR